ncbi:MAG: D-alanine--D-alanine ligase [Desulfotalea sp.]
MQEETGKIKVALIAGGTSHEREVSLMGAEGVAKALDINKYEVKIYDSASDLPIIAKEADDIDFALIILHGIHGEDGTIQGFLELLGIPYQGSGVLGSAMAMDKDVAKIAYDRAGLPIAPWQVVGDDVDVETLVAGMGLPVVVKPSNEGSSIGISIAHTVADLKESLVKARKYTTGAIMVEKFIKGRELTCAVLGNETIEALPVLEIVPGEEFPFFDYEAKYQPGASEEICPAHIDNDLRSLVQDLAVKAHRCLYLRGYSRTDFIYGDDGKLYLLETNTIPGMTATSILPQEAEAHGLSYSQLLDRLIELGLE